MNEMMLAGLLLILSALPGLGLGLAVLMGKWRPASFAAARDPERARVATGRFLLLVDAMLLALGVALIVMPATSGQALALWGAVAVVGVASVAAIALVRAVRT